MINSNKGITEETPIAKLLKEETLDVKGIAIPRDTLDSFESLLKLIKSDPTWSMFIDNDGLPYGRKEVVVGDDRLYMTIFFSWEALDFWTITESTEFLPDTYTGLCRDDKEVCRRDARYLGMIEDVKILEELTLYLLLKRKFGELHGGLFKGFGGNK